MRLHAASVVVIVTGLALVVGCGGGDDDGSGSDEQDAGRAAKTYADAVAAGDAATACEFEHPPNTGDRCVESLEEEIRSGDPLASDLGEFKGVRLKGDVARANFSKGFLLLSKHDGKWTIGASDPAADELGAPDPPKNLERCSPERERELREENKRLGIPVEKGPLYCPSDESGD